MLFRRARSREYDPYKLASPQIYLWRMMIFLIITAFLVLILYNQTSVAFLANPGLNGVINRSSGDWHRSRLSPGPCGCFPEIKWVNTFRIAEPGIEVERPPVLLAPMATLLGDRIGRMAISTQDDAIDPRFDPHASRRRSRVVTLSLSAFWYFSACSVPSGACCRPSAPSPTPSAHLTSPRPIPA